MDLNSHFALFSLHLACDCPKKLSEKDFWTKYCRAEYLLRTKNTLAAKAEAAEDEELAMFLKTDDILAKEAKLKV